MPCHMQWANLATVWYLVIGSGNAPMGTMVYALADGPLAGALLVWQSAWVFGSAAHSVRQEALLICYGYCRQSNGQPVSSG